MKKRTDKDSQWKYQFCIPCNTCRKNAILEMRKLGLRFRIRGQNILGNFDVYQFCKDNFAEFDPMA